MPRFDEAQVGILHRDGRFVFVTSPFPSFTWNPASAPTLDIIFTFAGPSTLTIFLDGAYTPLGGDEVKVMTVQNDPVFNGLITWAFPVRFTAPVTDSVPTAGFLAQTLWVGTYEVLAPTFLMVKTPYP